VPLPTAAIVVALTALTLALIQGATWGWGSAATVGGRIASRPGAARRRRLIGRADPPIRTQTFRCRTLWRLS